MEVLKIPASKSLNTFQPLGSTVKRRVAAYARVSTDSDEQLTSYEAQVDYYHKYISSRDDWELVNIYTDEGISACMIKNRSGFREMVNDALAGKIDLIITKSISRFARNTVDSLVTIRKLKEKRVECYFEKENIWTFDSKGELLITIMSSIAQEESRSISENVTWGHRKRMADGKILLPYANFLGYRKGADGLPEIVPEEAETVNYIYRSFIQGMTPNKICKELMKRGILTAKGRSKWHSSTVLSILTNEKYRGSALLQKSFTVDFLTKKTKKNEGEVPQYYVEHSHPPIIDPEEFELVQAEIARRQKLGLLYSGGGAFSSKIICGTCGGFYGSKLWHSTDKYRKTIWRCNNKYKTGCKSPHVDDAKLRQIFVDAYNSICEHRDDFLESCKQIRDMLTDKSSTEKTLKKHYEEYNDLDLTIQTFIRENALHPQEKDFYNRKIAEFDEQRSSLEEKIQKLETQKENAFTRREFLNTLIRELEQRNGTLTEFDDKLCRLMVENITVSHDGLVIFTFWNGEK